MLINRKQKSLSPSVQKNYTLMEIVVVIGIMVTLMAVALPSFSAMMRGQGVEGAARNMCQTLKLARTYAINNRKYIAVLFPKANLDDDYHFRSYRVCIVTRRGQDPNYTYEFKRWISNENWEFFPTGVAIYGIETDAIDKKTGTPEFAPTFSATKDVSQVDCEEIGYGTSMTIPAIIFKSNGRSVLTTSDTYIGLGNGTPSGGKVLNTNPDAEPVNIRIGQFSGRITYGTE